MANRKNCARCGCRETLNADGYCEHCVIDIDGERARRDIAARKQPACTAEKDAYERGVSDARAMIAQARADAEKDARADIAQLGRIKPGAQVAGATLRDADKALALANAENARLRAALRDTVAFFDARESELGTLSVLASNVRYRAKQALGIE